ncbi:MAG TPA: glycine--tRNA ligase subunit alpha [Thermoanaerobaculia bacterium]|nr:glycine--tRNA ligase subunit alpha [Thermoanaerobaculia bacterium]
MLTLQRLIAELSAYWEEQGCLIEQPYDQPMGAGTMHPATFLRVLGPEAWRCAYVQPSRRPADGRYGENPFRLAKHLQLQVVLKPSPEDVQELYLRSLERLGIDRTEHDIRFEEDNWESPTLGAWGVGWQVVMDGMEITQFTYFQQAGGIDLAPITAEITYGLERIAMFLSKSNSIFDIRWNEGLSYGDVRRAEEYEMSKYYFEAADTERTALLLDSYEQEAKSCLAAGLVLPAYEATLQCSHLFNVLDARGAISATDRVGAIRRVRELACACARAYLDRRTAAAGASGSSATPAAPVASVTT